MDQTIYKEKGYKNRKDYLYQLSVEYGVPYDAVVSAANTLGSNEDFDGLITMLEEWED